MKRIPVGSRSGRIYLVGFSGSGKSTIGPILGNTLGYAFVDLDQAIERASGSTVTELFRTEGEAAFRGREHQALARLALQPRLVVSFGGGALTHPPTLTLALESGVVVYLEASREEILNRLRKKTDRPLLLGADGVPMDGEALLARITDLYAARESTYRQADLIVPTDQESLGHTVDQIVRRLYRLPGAAFPR